MSFGYWGSRGSSKRSRDMKICEECDDDFDMEDDEWDVCGDCQRSMCNDCCQTLCKFCETNEGDAPTAFGPVCCEMCMEWCPKCKEAAGPEGADNQDVYHKCCLQHHIKECNSQSRAQGTYTAAKMERESTEKALKNAKQELVHAQNRVARLTAQLEQNTKDEAAAKAKLDMEASSSSKIDDGDDGDKKKPASSK